MSGGVIAVVVIIVAVGAVALTATMCVIFYRKRKKLYVPKKRLQDLAKYAEEASTVPNPPKAACAPQQGSELFTHVYLHEIVLFMFLHYSSSKFYLSTL